MGKGHELLDEDRLTERPLGDVAAHNRYWRCRLNEIGREADMLRSAAEQLACMAETYHCPESSAARAARPAPGGAPIAEDNGG